MPATIEIPTTRPGRTLTLSAFPDGSDTAAFTGESLTEETNRPGVYSYSNSTETGLHLLVAYDSLTPVWQSWAVLATSGTVVAAESRYEALYLDASVSSRSTFNASSDKVVLHATQSDYAPAKAGDEMALVNDAITASKFDESTAFPLTSQDSGSTRVARTGSDSDTLETISDQMDDLKSTAEAISVSAARRIVIQGAKQFERPETGSTVYTIEVRTYSPYGADVDADTTPTLTVTGKSSGDLSANLGTASNPSTGRYLWEYTVEDDATIEELIFGCSADIDSETFTISLITQVTDFVSETFTAADRSKINAIHAKLPSKDYLTGTANSDGDVQASDMTGDFPGSVASVSGNVGGNVTGSIGSLASQAKADVNAEADQALSDYAAAKPADIPSASTIASAVWSNGSRTLSTFGSLVSDIATAVWSATERTLSAFAFTPSIDSTQYSAIAKSTEIPDISGLAEKTDLPTDFDTVSVEDGKIAASSDVQLTEEQIEIIAEEISDNLDVAPVIVNPMAANDSRRTRGVHVTLFTGEAHEFYWPAITSGNGDNETPVDLTEFADKVLVVADKDKRILKRYSDEEITVRGDENNIPATTLTGEITAYNSTFYWSLRLEDSGYVLGHGTGVVEYTPN